MSSVAYLHSLGIVHRNLKPENIMLRSTSSDTDFALLDFSFSKHVEDAARDQNICGTADYIAPEVFTSRLYSTAVDVWACGVILYILLAGYPPFDDDDDEKLLAKITVPLVAPFAACSFFYCVSCVCALYLSRLAATLFAMIFYLMRLLLP